jgi:hypothetical protein
MSSGHSSDGFLPARIYAVTWTLSELEARINRYAQVIARQRLEERAADEHSSALLSRGGCRRRLYADTVR